MPVTLPVPAHPGRKPCGRRPRTDKPPESRRGPARRLTISRSTAAGRTGGCMDNTDILDRIRSLMDEEHTLRSGRRSRRRRTARGRRRDARPMLGPVAPTPRPPRVRREPRRCGRHATSAPSRATSSDGPPGRRRRRRPTIASPPRSTVMSPSSPTSDTDDRIVLVHTGVPKAIDGHGVGTRVGARGDRRRRGPRARPSCRVARSPRRYLREHPDVAERVKIDWPVADA